QWRPFVHTSEKTRGALRFVFRELLLPGGNLWRLTTTRSANRLKGSNHKAVSTQGRSLAVQRNPATNTIERSSGGQKKANRGQTKQRRQRSPARSGPANPVLPQVNRI